ncbi:hypothetical protein E3J61_03245 [Candidatus Dependentiae bacterium]|nr:MAG: hypothetical protein E3J61_03245 [Candidatus Dependentiae bacterium]
MKMQTISKKVCLIGSFFLLLSSSVHTIQPAAGDTLRKIKEAFQKKLPGLINKARSKVQGSLSSAYQKVRGLSKEAVIERLLSDVTKLGSQIGKIKTCMLSGEGCSSGERAAFYATAITILALTAVVVRFTITVAATSKEPDQELNKAIESTSKEVEGWKPAAVFQRLTNKLATFKQNLLSMKQCLIKRHCTKQQKRALYGTAAGIVALVTIAIGVGIGIYLYAQKQEEEKPEPTKPPVPPKPGEPVPEAELQKLAIDQAAETPAPPKTYSEKFRAFMRKATTMKEKGKTEIQEAAQAIKQALKEKSTQAKEALGEKADKLKQQKLFLAAKASLAKAQKIAEGFVEKVKNINIADSIKEVLNIDLSTMKASVQAIWSSSPKIMEPINELYEVKLFEQLDTIVNKIGVWQQLGEELSQNSTELLKQWSQRGTHATRVGTWWWGDPQAEQYPLAAKLDQLLQAYPEMVSLINQLDLATPGRLIGIALQQTAELLKNATQLKMGIGDLNLVFFTPEVRKALFSLSEDLYAKDRKSLAGLIVSTTRLGTGNLIKAPIDVNRVVTTQDTVKKFLYSFAWHLTNPATFASQLKELPTLAANIGGNAAGIQPESEVLQTSLEMLTNNLYNMPSEIKTKFVQQLNVKGKLLQNVAHAPTILRYAIGQQIQQIKKQIDTTLQIGNSILLKVGTILQNAAKILTVVNMLMGSNSHAYVNEDVVIGFNQMSEMLTKMMSTIRTLGIDIQAQQLPSISPATF